MKVAIVPKSQLGNDWTAEAHLGNDESVSEGKPMSSTVETCWTEGCDKPRSDERNGYWCTEHHDERRARITKLMSELKHDSQGNPRKSPDTRCLGLTGAGKQCSRNGRPTASGGYRCKSHLGAERYDQRISA